MDVDAISHRKGKQPMKSKQFSKPKTPSNPARRLPPHPNASSSSKPPPNTSSNPQKSKRPFYCFLCNKEGHYARDCRTRIDQIDETHFKQILCAMDEYQELRWQEEDGADQFGDAAFEEYAHGHAEEEENEENEENLITFDQEPTDSENGDDSTQRQGF